VEPLSSTPEYADLYSKTSTFISIDVVDSTALKGGENEQDIIYTFLTYHKLIRELAYACHGEISTISGDGVMCRFERPDDAVSAAQKILEELPNFNKRQNRLSRPFALRLGVNTGEVYESQSMTAGQIISHTVDVAAKLQQACPPNHALISQETLNALKQKPPEMTRTGWNAHLKTTAYQLSGTGVVQRAPRVLPNPVRVLVVDDDLPEMTRLRKVLWTRKHDALPVYTPAQAALCTTSWRPHVILTSVDLAWNAGWDLLKALRSDPAASHIPVILMSQFTTGETIEKCFGLGANGFLRKPLEETQLGKRMDMILREFYL